MSCARCENWAEEESELCAQCELEALAQYDDALDQERADSLEGGE